MILDGHCSHILSIELLECAKSYDVSLLCLPLHTTHVLQPLDNAFFGPFKVFFEVATTSWVNQNIERKVTRYQLGSLVKTAWDKFATVGNGTSGFKSMGIICFDRNVIPDHFFVISDNMQDTDEKILKEEEKELLPSQPQTQTSSRTSGQLQSSTGAGQNDSENQSSTKVLHAIALVLVLFAAMKTGRPVVGAVLWTSQGHHEKLRLSAEKKG